MDLSEPPIESRIFTRLRSAQSTIYVHIIQKKNNADIYSAEQVSDHENGNEFYLKKTV